MPHRPGPFHCKYCGTEDPDRFILVRDLRRGMEYYDRTHCRQCRNERTRNNRRKRTPEERRRMGLMSNYGLTLEEYMLLLEVQGNKCATCHRPHELAPGERNWPVDHDHATGRVRGVLCASCNKALGYVYDNADTLERMVRYLGGE